MSQWTARSIFHARRSIYFWKRFCGYGASVSPLLNKRAYTVSQSIAGKNIYIDRRSVHFWKESIYIYMNRQSGRICFEIHSIQYVSSFWGYLDSHQRCGLILYVLCGIWRCEQSRAFGDHIEISQSDSKMWARSQSETEISENMSECSFLSSIFLVIKLYLRISNR